VVIDGELVVWRAGRFDFGALQDRLRSGWRRVRNLVTAAPAASVVFDLLGHDGRDQRDRPYRKRRRKLEKLLARAWLDGLVPTPSTTDAAVASSWMLGHATGIELRGRPILPGRYEWPRAARQSEVPGLSRRTARRPR
jgi:ATP-dependent DNA ligase